MESTRSLVLQAASVKAETAATMDAVSAGKDASLCCRRFAVNQDLFAVASPRLLVSIAAGAVIALIFAWVGQWGYALLAAALVFSSFLHLVGRFWIGDSGRDRSGHLVTGLSALIYLFVVLVFAGQSLGGSGTSLDHRDYPALLWIGGAAIFGYVCWRHLPLGLALRHHTPAELRAESYRRKKLGGVGGSGRVGDEPGEVSDPQPLLQGNGQGQKGSGFQPSRLLWVVPLGLVAVVVIMRVAVPARTDSGDYSVPPNSGVSTATTSADRAKEMCYPPPGTYQDIQIRTESAVQTGTSTWHVVGTFSARDTSTGLQGMFGLECDADFGGSGQPPQTSTAVHPISP